MAQEKGEGNSETTSAAGALPDYSRVSAAELNEVEDLRNQMDQYTRSLKSLTDVDGSFPERDDVYAFSHVEFAYLIVFGLRGWSKTRNTDQIDRIFRGAIGLAKLYIESYHIWLRYMVENRIEPIDNLKSQIAKAKEKLKARPTDTFSIDFIAVAEELQIRVNRVDFLERLDARILEQEYTIMGFGELSKAYELAEEYLEMHMVRELEALIREKHKGVGIQDKYGQILPFLVRVGRKRHGIAKRIS